MTVRRDPRQGTFSGSDGTRLWYSVEGSGPVLLCCNGLGCSVHFWRRLTDHFRGLARVVLWDYPGHGHSPPPARPSALTIEAAADDAARLLDRLRIERACLIGHSMGVQVILEAAHRHPGRVAALAAICGAYRTPGAYFLHSSWLDRLLPFLQRAASLFPQTLAVSWRGLLAGPIAQPLAHAIGVNRRLIDPADLEVYLDHLRSIDLDVLVEMAQAMAAHSSERYLAELAQPALVVAGTSDHFTPYWLSLRLSELLPGAELLSVPEGSHVAHIEMPRLVNGGLEDFLRRRVWDKAGPPGPARTGNAVR